MLLVRQSENLYLDETKISLIVFHNWHIIAKNTHYTENIILERQGSYA